MLEKISNVYRNRRSGSRNARSPSPTFNYNLRSLLFSLSWSFSDRSQMACDLIYKHFVLCHGNTRTHWNFKTEHECSWAWWYLSAISALGRWRQKGQEFKVIFSYLVTLRPAWVIWDLLKRKTSNQNVLVTALHSPHIRNSPAKILSCLRNVMDFEQLLSIQNPNKCFHTLWLVKWASEWALILEAPLALVSLSVGLVGICFWRKQGIWPVASCATGVFYSVVKFAAYWSSRSWN